jgi:heme-degrading monooxygenase HmoA
MHVSVTRLHLRSVRYFPMFVWYALSSTRQARRSPGFKGGWLGGESIHGNWTATVWDSDQAMRAFRNSGMHLRSMPRLLRWCDEASFVHWEQADATPPGHDEAYDRLARDGKVSKVLRPSSRHAGGRTVGDRKPKGAQVLTPLP